MKIVIRFFNIFYSKFIKLAVKLKVIKTILLQKFIYKLFSHIKDWKIFGLKYVNNNKNLTMRYLKIYHQIIAIN